MKWDYELLHKLALARIGRIYKTNDKRVNERARRGVEMKTEDIIFIISVLMLYFLLGFCSRNYLGHVFALLIVIVLLIPYCISKKQEKRKK